MGSTEEKKKEEKRRDSSGGVRLVDFKRCWTGRKGRGWGGDTLCLMEIWTFLEITEVFGLIYDDNTTSDIDILSTFFVQNLIATLLIAIAVDLCC